MKLNSHFNLLGRRLNYEFVLNGTVPFGVDWVSFPREEYEWYNEFFCILKINQIIQFQIIIWLWNKLIRV